MKKRVLFITTQLPYPPVSGGVIKSWKLVERLAQEFDLSLITALKDEDQTHEKAFLEKTKLAFYFSTQINTPRTALNLLKSYILAPSLNIYRNASKSLKKKVNEQILLADVVLVDHYEMFQYIPKTYTGPVILHEHNAEYMLWQRLAELETNWFKKLVLYLEQWRIKQAERCYGVRANLVLAAPNDIQALSMLGISKEKFRETYHLGDDSMSNTSTIDQLDPEKKEKSLFYMGTLSWEANIDGLLWFLKDIWPSIKREVADVQFYIVGKNPDERLINATKEDKNIQLTGFLKDPNPLIQRCRVAIAPLRFGSGTKVKVLTYMYQGAPVVTTPMGIEGLSVEHKKHLFCTHEAPIFAQYCIELLQNPSLGKQIGLAGQEIALTRFGWRALLDAHVKHIKDLTALFIALFFLYL